MAEPEWLQAMLDPLMETRTSVMVDRSSSSCSMKAAVASHGIERVVSPLYPSMIQPLQDSMASKALPPWQRQSMTWISSLADVTRGSGPQGHSRFEQSWPDQPGSQIQPWIMSASQLVYSIDVKRSSSWSTVLAASAIVMHFPCPLHFSEIKKLLSPIGHLRRWHAFPSKPARHLHWPVALSQKPNPEHSTPSRWAVCGPDAGSAQALPLGQTRNAQS
mmetsp:Transcript_20770/g.41547  ORF Transcript_20770/g.41547 Transcript_20770/m.41547 type:complete len:218 (-) Transcript_20770:71-724(-)